MKSLCRGILIGFNLGNREIVVRLILMNIHFPKAHGWHLIPTSGMRVKTHTCTRDAGTYFIIILYYIIV